MKRAPTLLLDPDLQPSDVENLAEADPIALLAGNASNDNHYIPEIYTYITQKNIEIPKTAFDSNLRDGIEKAYERLLTKYRSLKTDADKKAFAEYYAPFLNLKDSLDKMGPNLGATESNYLFEKTKRTLRQSISREWRWLILQTYGEEYLNDFEYRNALATGNLYPILATRKLLSPLKALSVLINGLLILPHCAWQYCCTQALIHLLTEGIQLITDYRQGVKNYKRIVFFAIKLFLVIATPVSLILLMNQLSMPVYATILAIPLITRTLSVLASPVNQLFRPLATYFNISPSWFTALSFVALPALIGGLFYFGAFASLMAFLPYASIALVLLGLIGSIKLTYDLYTLNSTVGIIYGIYVFGGMLVGGISSVLYPTPASSIESDAMLSFFDGLSNCAKNYLAISGIQDLKTNNKALSASLPLPNEPIPEEIESATLLGCTNASTQSHRLFNTPINAECLPAKGRTVWQQTWCFFGGEAKVVSKFKDDAWRASEPQPKGEVMRVSV